MTRASVPSQKWLIALAATIAVVVAALSFTTPANAEVDTFLLGNGQDGAVNFGNGTHRPNAVAPVPAGVTAGATSLVRGAITAGGGTGPVTFANNRLVMIYQANGWSGTATSGAQSPMSMSGSRSGKWEFARISTVAGTTLNFTNPIVNTFDAGSTQVIAVPEYTTVTVSNAGANITGRAWDGTIGGAVVILANSTFNFTAAGVVQADVLGFRGGVSWNNNPGGTIGCTQLDGQQAGGKGEGIYGTAFTTTTPQPNANQTGYGNYLNGGGGGDCFNAGGGGGSNAGLGGRGGNTLPDYDGANPGRTVGGYGGLALTYNAYDRMVLGGGGGAGDRNNAGSGNGGRGGGFVFVRAASLSGTGTLRANAGNGEDGDDDGTPYDGAGGGGAGGVVYLRTTGTAACTAVAANGGNGGNNGTTSGYNWTPGAGGSGGYVYIQKSGGTCNATVNGGTRGTNTNTGQVYGATSGAAGSNTLNATALAAPTVTLAAPTNGSHVADTTPTVSGTSTANATINVYVDGTLNGSTTASGAGNWTYDSSALSQGSHTVRVQAELAGIYSAVSGTNTFTVDTVSPAVSISSPTTGTYTSDNTPTVTFTATDANAGSTTCSVDAGAYGACSSPWTTGTLADGLHTLNVRHTDLAGNVTTSSVSVTVDTTLPVVSISSLTEGAVTADSTPDFTFSVTETNLGTTTCSVDGGAFVACSSPYTTGALSDGAHNIRVRHVDLAGNTTTTPQRNFTVDTTGPAAPTINTGPSGVVGSNSATFTFTGAEGGGTYQCRIDSGSWGACVSGVNYPGLTDGSHTFEVRQIDGVGNVGAIASRTWTVDTTSPSVNVTAPTEGSYTNDSTPSATFSVTDANVGTTECATDGGAFSPCTSPYTTSTLSDGAHSISVRHTDQGGNVTTVVRNFTVDTTAPVVTVSAPADGSVTNDSTPTLTYNVTDTNLGTTTCSLDGGAFGACTDPLPALLDGPHSIAVRHIDLAGNSTTVTNNFTVDTTAPAAPAITSPADGSVTNDNTPTISGTAEANSSVEVFADGISIGTTTADGSGNWSFTPGAPLADDTYDFTARATDAAGNESVDSSVVEVTIDTTGPAAPTIDTGPTGTVGSSNATFTFTPAEPGGSVECQIDGAGWTACSGTINYLGLPDGPHTFEVRQIDDAGNVGSIASQNWSIDTTPPAAPAIDSGPPSVSGNVNSTFSFTGAESGGSFECNIDGVAWFVCTDPTNVLGLPEGAHTFEVRQLDDVGNTGPATTYNWTIDTTPPTVNITPPPVLTNSASGIDISFTFGDNVAVDTVECQTNSGGYAPCTSPYATGALQEGNNNVYVRVTDTAGNVTVQSVSFTLDSTPPNAPTIDSPADGTVTNDTTPTTSGTAEPNSTVEVFADGISIGTTTADGSGNWSFTPGAPLAEDIYTFTARATDAAGNESVDSNAVEVTIDTTAPAAPVITNPADGSSTNDTTPTISGTAEANSTVDVYVDGNLIGTTTADGSGNWSLVSSALAPGDREITATSTDEAGNESVPSAPVTITIDTTIPVVVISSPSNGAQLNDTTPTIIFSATDDGALTIECSVDGGAYVACGPTNYTTGALLDGPHSVSVRATDAGGNVGTGVVNFVIDTATPAAPVITSPADGTVTNDNTPTISGTAEANSTVEVFADGISLGTTTTDGSGNWTFTPGSGIADGTYDFTATATDAAGNTSAASAAVEITIDTTAPSAPAITSPADGTVTNDNTPTVSGTAEANSTVEVFADGISLGTTTADGSGNWTFTPGSSIADGTYDFTATATDAAGNESVESAPVEITIDTAAPAAPVISSPADGTVTNDNTPTVSGTAEANSTVELFADGISLGTTTADGSGNWTFTPGSSIADGTYDFTATAIDEAGNESVESAPVEITIDTVAPAAPAITAPADGTVTNDTTPTISGTAEANSTVEVFSDGVSLGTTTADGSGNWSFTPGVPLAEDTYTFTATATDEAGNESVESAGVDVTIDTTAPAAPAITSPADGSTTNDTTPTISGTAEADSTVEVFADGISLGTTTADGSGNWSFTPVAPLALDTYDFTATATDEAGNESLESAAVTLTIDGTVPSVNITAPGNGDFLNDPTPTIEFTVTDDSSVTIECSVDGGAFVACGPTDYTTGALLDGPHSVTVRATDAGGNAGTGVVNFTIDTAAPSAPIIDDPLSGTTTSDNTPTIVGTAEANSTVIVYADGNAIGTTTADGSGGWSFTPAGPIADGTYDITATSTDEAGNVSADSNTVELTIDTTAPAAPVIASPADGTVTNDATPTLSGTAEANSTVSVYADGNLLGTTTADGSGNWSFTPGTPLAEATYEFTATSTDAANNTSVASNAVDITIDTTAPNAPVILDPVDGSVTNDNTPTISGTAEANSEVSILLDGNPFATVTADGSGNWSYTPVAAIPDGTYGLTATSTDEAGNVSATSNNAELTIDTAAPSAPTIDSPADESVTGDNTPTISGTAEINSTVSVYADGNLLGTTTADGSGNWSFTPGAPLADATYEFTATSTDAANNTSVDSNAVDVTIDTVAPAAPVVVTPADGSSTNDNTPTISGTAEANSTVEVFVDGASIGTTTADGSGDWTLVSPPLAAGARAIHAVSTDAAGNDSVDSNTSTVTIDTTAPLVSISSPANAAALNDTTPTIVFSATDDGALTIECSIDGGGFVACGPTDFTTGALLDGGHSVTVRATDTAGNSASAVVNFTIDTVAPAAPVITTPADGSYTTDTTPTISGTAEPNSSVAIEIDGAPHGPVTADGSGNWTYTPATPLAAGLHDVVARATDSAGNTGPDSNLNEFTVDATAPNVSITGPTGGSTTNDPTPDVTFNATDDNPVTTTCSVGGGSFVACSSPFNIGPLTDGPHSVVVRAEDGAGNSSQQTVNFTVDTTPPDTTLTDTPPSITSSTSATFEFTSEPGATFECSINGDPYGGCFSPDFYAGLSEGANTFSVRATDEAGNVDPTPATYIWTIDTTAPAAPVISGPADASTTNDSTPTITGTAEPNSTVTVYVDGNPVGTTTTDGGGNWTFAPSSPLSEGPHIITADAEDPAGNTSAASNSVALTIDTTAPQTTITVTPPSESGVDTATFEFTASEVGSTFQCSLNGAAFTACSSPLNLTNLPEGSNTLEVRATDPAGNADSTPASYTWNVDTTPPSAPLVTAPANGSMTNDTTPTISGTAEAGSTVTVYVDGNPIGTAVANGSGNWTLTSPVLAEGAHAIVATATDDIGNISGNSPTVNFTVDTTPPDGAVVQENGTGNPGRPASFDISSDDPNATMTCSINGGTPVACGPTFTAPTLPGGTYTLVVVYTDEASNTSTRSINFTVTGAPAQPIDPPSADPLPSACFPKGITIYELAVKGNKLNIKGFARSQYIGQEVTINFQPTKTKVIGKTKVNADGSFSVTVAAPAKKLRTKGSSRYRANVGGESSLWFKLARRMGSNLATYSNGTLNVSGALTKPLDPKAVLTVTVRTGCNDPWTKVGTTKVGKSGTFKAGLPVATDSKVLFVRMYAKVRKSAKSTKTMTTYSFVVPVVTGR